MMKYRALLFFSLLTTVVLLGLLLVPPLVAANESGVTNTPPVAVADHLEVVVDGVARIPYPGVLVNDYDPDGDPLDVYSITQPAVGSVRLLTTSVGFAREIVAPSANRYPSLAEIGGVAMVSYIDGAGPGALWLARRVGNGWTREQVVDSDAYGPTSLAEIDGQPAISFYDSRRGLLQYARYDGASWQVETVDSPGVVGEYSSLAEIDGRPAISYLARDAGELRYARHDGTTWQIEVVEPAPGFWSDTSLAEIDGRPAISYVDVSRADLKYARHDGTAWQIESVDTVGFVGRGGSLAEVGGVAMISYFDDDHRQLRLARRDGAGWRIENVTPTARRDGQSSLVDWNGRPAIALGGQRVLFLYHDGSDWQEMPLLVNDNVCCDLGVNGPSLALVGGQPAIAHSGADLTFNPYGSGPGGFEYIPDYDSCAPVEFSYRATDGAATSNRAEVIFVRMSCFNLPPNARVDRYRFDTDMPLTVTAPGLLENDLDGHPALLRVVTRTAPLHGTLTLDDPQPRWVHLPPPLGTRVRSAAFEEIAGRLTVAYFDGALNLATFDGVEWQIERVDEAVEADDVALAEVNGQPVIAYYDEVKFDFRVARRTPGGWRVEIVDSAGDVGRYPSVAEVAGDVAVLYHDNTNNRLKLARLTGSGWQVETVDTGPSGISSGGSLLEVDGQPAISYSSNFSLKYARYDGSAWQNEVVESSGSVGRDSALALVGGRPAISYIDDTNRRLRYARHDGNTWQIETVDQEVGLNFGHIELDGQPQILYASYRIEELRLARHDGTDWKTTDVDGRHVASYDTRLLLVGENVTIAEILAGSALLLQQRVTGSGGFTYHPDPAYCGVDSFHYQATEIHLSSVPTQVLLYGSCVQPAFGPLIAR